MVKNDERAVNSLARRTAVAAEEGSFIVQKDADNEFKLGQLSHNAFLAEIKAGQPRKVFVTYMLRKILKFDPMKEFIELEVVLGWCWQ